MCSHAAARSAKRISKTTALDLACTQINKFDVIGFVNIETPINGETTCTQQCVIAVFETNQKLTEQAGIHPRTLKAAAAALYHPNRAGLNINSEVRPSEDMDQTEE